MAATPPECLAVTGVEDLRSSPGLDGDRKRGSDECSCSTEEAVGDLGQTISVAPGWFGRTSVLLVPGKGREPDPVRLG